MYFLIITFGFLLAMRGARPTPLQRPGEGLKRICLEAGDLLLTAGAALAFWAVAIAFEKTRLLAQEYAILGFGVAAYLLSRYQKKSDVFFLAATTIAFLIYSKQPDIRQELLLAWVISAGIAIFQTCFLGLRYKLLFSNMPASVKGWPSLCLLAGFISVVLWRLGKLFF